MSLSHLSLSYVSKWSNVVENDHILTKIDVKKPVAKKVSTNRFWALSMKACYKEISICMIRRKSKCRRHRRQHDIAETDTTVRLLHFHAHLITLRINYGSNTKLLNAK